MESRELLWVLSGLRGVYVGFFLSYCTVWLVTMARGGAFGLACIAFIRSFFTCGAFSFSFSLAHVVCLLHIAFLFLSFPRGVFSLFLPFDYLVCFSFGWLVILNYREL